VVSGPGRRTTSFLQDEKYARMFFLSFDNLTLNSSQCWCKSDFRMNFSPIYLAIRACEMAAKT
jgi:hypothetical protein